MLSKLRLAFSSSASAPSTPTSDNAASTSTTASSKRGRSSTVPPPNSTDSNTARIVHGVKEVSSTAIATSRRVPPGQVHHSPTRLPSPASASPRPINALLLLDPATPDALVPPSPRSSSPARSIHRSTTAANTSPLAFPRDRQENASNPAIASKNSISETCVASPTHSSSNYTPLATPISLNFPSAPFSTPATPPRAAISLSHARDSPQYLSGSRNSNRIYRTQSASHSPLNEPMKENYTSLPVPTPHHLLNVRKKTKSTATLPAWIISSFSSSSSSPKESVIQDKESKDTCEKRLPLEISQNGAIMPSRVPPIAASFPLRVDVRRGSLPVSSLSPDSASRPRSPSMQMHIQTLHSQQAQPNNQRSSVPSSSSVHPSSPHTPTRLDRPPLNAPSPLSTASSPYQLIDSSQCSSPSTETPESSSPARPSRRKSILGKRRNFTQVWNGSASPSSSVSTQGSTSNNNKKKGSKWHRGTSKRDTSTSGSGDHSSLLAASKRMFSKSVDDLSSFTKSSLLSSPVNYSRPRKSIDERRIGGNVNNMYIISNEPRSAGLQYAAGIDGGNGDAEEELEGLSSGSSASLAHSPIPSDGSISSMHSIQSMQTNKGNRSSTQSDHHHHQHHIYKVPKLPSSPSSPSRRGLNPKKESKAHRKNIPSSQVQLPPSISLPGGLCIESTASILASSMDIEPELPRKSSTRKSMDSRSVRSEISLGSSPGLAPAFDVSPTMPKSAPPVPIAIFTSDHTASTTSSFPMRPPLATRKSSGNASISTRSSGTARLPSFGSPKASPAPMPSSPSVNHSTNGTAAANTNSTLSKTARQRSSQIILIEGLLQRKTDHRSHVKATSWTFPFTTSSTSSGTSMFTSPFSTSSSKTQDSPSSASSKQRPSPGARRTLEANMREIDLSKGWKPFYAILRGTNLYLYKIPNEMNWQAKACFSNYTGSKSQPPALSASCSSSSSRLLSTYTSSTPLQSTKDMNEDKLKTSISNHSKAAYLLPLANSKFRITTSANKGDVFELLTEEGEVAILQAASKEEADRWMKLLSNTGVSVANKRASYLEAIGKLDLGDSLSQRINHSDTILERNSESHDRSMSAGIGGSTIVFRVPLERLVTREGGKIPEIAEFLFKEVENRGLFETGIYRVPGENRVMQAMQAKLNAGEHLDFQTNPSFCDPHNLASLTKLWLRELPEIISPTFYSAFIEANGVEGYEERLCAIRELVWQLPATSFHLLDRLCEHLHLIAEHELENQMHAPNLAIVFAPTMLRPPEGSDSYALLMSNLGKAAKLVASLIVQHNWIFSGQEVEEEAEVEAVSGDKKLETLTDSSQAIDDKETATPSLVSKDGEEASLPLQTLGTSQEELTREASIGVLQPKA